LHHFIFSRSFTTFGLVLTHTFTSARLRLAAAHTATLHTLHGSTLRFSLVTFTAFMVSAVYTRCMVSRCTRLRFFTVPFTFTHGLRFSARTTFTLPHCIFTAFTHAHYAFTFKFTTLQFTRIHTRTFGSRVTHCFGSVSFGFVTTLVHLRVPRWFTFTMVYCRHTTRSCAPHGSTPPQLVRLRSPTAHGWLPVTCACGSHIVHASRLHYTLVHLGSRAYASFAHATPHVYVHVPARL